MIVMAFRSRDFNSCCWLVAI